MDRVEKTRPAKKLTSEIVSTLPWVMLLIGIFCYIALVNVIFCYIALVKVGLVKGAKYEAKAEVLAAENEFLKGELEWYKAQLAYKVDMTDEVNLLPGDGD